MQQNHKVVRQKSFQIILLSTLLFLSAHVSAQEFPIPTNGSEWNNTVIKIDEVPESFITTRVEVLGDTIVNDIVYSKVYETWRVVYQRVGYCSFTSSGTGGYKIMEYIGAMRTNDTQQVEFIPMNEDTARVLYDFSLSEGDSIVIYGAHETYTAYIHQVDIQQINDSQRKHMTIEGIHGFYDMWIEGIGSVYGLLATYDRHWEKRDYVLSCYRENGDILYVDDPECTRCDVVTSTSSPTSQNDILTYPNPVTSSLFIEIQKSITPIQLFLYNVRGQMILARPVESSEIINIPKSELEKGLLFLEIIDENQYSHWNTIIVE